MASSIRLTYSGAPDTPPDGYARLYIDEYNGKLYLNMKRPDGSVQVFGTINIPLDVDQGGTGLSTLPGVGQLLIGTGTGYRLGDITAGPGINITRNSTTFQISTDISNIELVMPSEFEVVEQSNNGNNQFVVSKTSQQANKIYAGPTSGNDAVPVFRLLTANDLPAITKDKIANFNEEVQDVLAITVEDSASILFQYNDVDNKIKAFLSETGVTPGTYGSNTSIPSIQVDSQGRIISVTSITAYFLSEQITDLKEKIEDTIGDLVKDTDSIDAQYNDVLSRLELHVKPEYLITTNISQSENTRAPTSQAIKLYVDELIDAERTARLQEDADLSSSISTLEQQVGTNLQSLLTQLTEDLATETSERIAEDQQILNQINGFFDNAPAVLDSLIEIDQRFNEIEQAIVTGAQQQISTEIAERQAADAAINEEILRIDADIDVLEASLNAEVETRVQQLSELFEPITAKREVIQLTPELLNTSIDLQAEQMLHIMPNSIVGFVDRIGLFEGHDFTVTNGSNNRVALTLTNSARSLFDGTEVLRISYLTKIQHVYDRINSRRQVIDLTPQTLTQAIELEVEQLWHIMPNSVVAFVDRVGLFEAFDFNLADGPNNKVVLTFTQNSLEMLDGTEVLRISYLTKI